VFTSTFYRSSLTAVCASLFLINQATAQAPTISNLLPAPHSFKKPITTSVSAVLTPAATASLSVYSSQAGGLRKGITTLDNGTVSFAPATPFKAGETLSATLTSATGARYAWQFTTAVTGGSGKFDAGLSTPISTQPWSQDYLTLADVDGDSDLDVLVPYYLNQQSLGLMRNDGTGKLAALTDLAISSRCFRPGDIDGDGDLDLVCANTGAGLSLLRNNGSGTFTPASGIVNTSNQAVALALGDLDSDGDLDLIFAESASKILQVRFNDGTGTFTGNSQVSITSYAGRIELADIDNDGDLDALTGYGGTTAGPLNIRLNNGQGQFSGTGELPVGGYRGTIGLADFDDDGDVDIAVPLFQPDGKLSLWRNTGNGSFVQAGELPIGNAPTIVEIGDVDGDKDLDIITDGRDLSAPSFNVNLNLNGGTGNFTRQAAVPTSSSSSDLVLGDMDNDGDLDLVIYALSSNSNNSAGQITVHRNMGIPLPTSQASFNATAVSIWPNPVAQGADIHFELPAEAKEGKATLSDALGRPVRTLTFWGRNATLSTTHLARGLYLLTVQPVGQLPSTRRIVLE